MPIVIVICILVLIALLVTSPGLAALALLFGGAGTWAGWIFGWNACARAVKDEAIERAEADERRRLRGWYQGKE